MTSVEGTRASRKLELPVRGSNSRGRRILGVGLLLVSSLRRHRVAVTGGFCRLPTIPLPSLPRFFLEYPDIELNMSETTGGWT
jgi:hypothetical protein